MATRGELLKSVSQPGLVLLVGDLSRPWALLPSLERWYAVLEAQGLGKIPLVVVGCKSDLLGEGSQDGLFRALRAFCVARGQCALVFVSLVKGSNCGLLQALVQQMAVGAAPEVVLTDPESDDADLFFIPAGWDTQERVDALPEASIPQAPVMAIGSSKRKEEESVEAESEQAFLLRHMKLLETLKEEEQQQDAARRAQQPTVLDAPATPSTSRNQPSAATPGEGGFSTPFATPMRTPSRQPPAVVADGSDNAGLADFFDSLLSKDKSPHKPGKPK